MFVPEFVTVFPVEFAFASSPACCSAPCLRAVLPFAAGASALCVRPSSCALSGWVLCAFFGSGAGAAALFAAAERGGFRVVSVVRVRAGLWRVAVAVSVVLAPVPPRSCPVAFLPLR